MLTIEQTSENELLFNGRFDASQAEHVQEKLSGLTETTTLDFANLDYISSMGLGVLVGTFKQLNENGHTLVLKNLNQHVHDVFKFTRLDKIFTII